LNTTANDLKYWVGFNIIPGIGRVKFSQLEQHFGALETAWQAPASELKRAGLDNGIIDEVVSWRSKIDLDAEMGKLVRYGVQAITFHDSVYPARLKEIYDYPR